MNEHTKIFSNTLLSRELRVSRTLPPDGIAFGAEQPMRRLNVDWSVLEKLVADWVSRALLLHPPPARLAVVTEK